MNVPLSLSRPVGDVLLTSGITALEAGVLSATEFEGQAHYVFSKVADVLEESGLTWSHVRGVSLYLASMTDFEVMNQIYRSYLREPYPVRTTIQCGLYPGVLIEMSVVADRHAAG